MHPCLRTPELLLNIFQYVRDDGDPHDHGLNRGVLAGLARACKNFKEPALDMLWSSMDSFLPLLRCLPAHTLEIDIVQSRKSRLIGPYPKLTINSNLQFQDLTRMRYYASRIKVLYLDRVMYKTSGQRDPFIDSVVYDRLLAAKPFAGPLLPNIRRLAISLSYLNSKDPVPNLVFGPHLRKLRISGTCDNIIDSPIDWDNLGGLLTATGASRSLVDMGISLEDSYTYCIPLLIDCPTSFISDLTSCGRLSKLDLQPFRVTRRESIQAIGLIPHLELLTMNVDMEKLGTLAELPPDYEGYFTNLKRLKLVVSGPQVISDLLSQWKATKLESLAIERFNREFHWDLRELFKDFGRSLPPKTLRALSLCNGIDPFFTVPYNRNTSDLTHDALKYLFPFRQLDKLSINIGARLQCSDIHLAEYASAWPRLRHLELYEREFSEPAKATVAGVQSLLTALPSLRHLTLRFNASNPSTFPELGTVQPHRLRYLDVCTSDADDSATLVPFLERAFPMLEDLHWGWVYEHPQLAGSRWETRLEDEDEQIRNDDSHECWISSFDKLVNLPRLKRY